MHCKGWLLDLYEDAEDGVRLWFILDDGRRVCLNQPLPVTFYVTGSHERLHQCCLMLKNQPGVRQLSRAEKQDVFKTDPVCVLQINMADPLSQRAAFQKIKKSFPELTFYNADLGVHIHHAARFNTFPLAFCELAYDDETGEIQMLSVLNSRWDVVPLLPVLRTMTIEPNCNPAKKTPEFLKITDPNGRHQALQFKHPAETLAKLNEVIAVEDPDILQTRWGDDWLFPLLLEWEKETGCALAFNRDNDRRLYWKKEVTYFSYGQIVFRGREAHLFGRCHIDLQNAIMWGDYGMAGTLESARVTTLPIEQAARVSPGSGISAMQMITALEKGVLVPEQKQQVETPKNALELVQKDRGGLVYQPRMGLYCNVAQIDFTSMYPAVIINSNISPEVPLPDGLKPASAELGVVPLTLKPLYEKRVALKEKLLETPDKNCPAAKTCTARASALKWLLVVCFGFLGYKNARFGRIEAHEAVTNGGREALLLAKEACEDHGFEVLHLFVDALWIQQPGYCQVADFKPVLEEISRRTGLKISLDGIFRWVAFLPSRVNDNQPVPNRYFGVFKDGSLKIRGIEARRHDAPPWVAAMQTAMLTLLSRAHDARQLPDYLPGAFRIFADALTELNENRVDPESLVLTIRISRDLELYKSPTAAVRAAKQLLERTGKRTVPGQKIRFLYTREDVYAWDQPGNFQQEEINKPRYRELLARAAATILYPFGINPAQLSDFARGTLQFSLEDRLAHTRSDQKLESASPKLLRKASRYEAPRLSEHARETVPAY